jgi:formylglycine-generating enzyme required for sulfatase activity
MELLQVRELSGAKGDVFVGKFEVTQAEYTKVMSANPSQQPQGDTLPVNNLASKDAEEFCKRLTALDKATPGFPSGYSYVIPTVAQWETLTSGSDPALGVFSLPPPNPRLTSPSPVGSKGSDGNGLCDLYGNVWEICLDPARGAYRMRGGSYNDTAAGFKVVFSDSFNQPSPRIGFRVLLVPPGQ